jgi:Domain of unknown function (DUF4345)
MRAFRSSVRLLAVVAFAIAALEASLGVAGERLLGAEVPFVDPVLDSHIRFFAGLWIGVGALLLVFASDVIRYATPLRILLGSVALGGVGRLVSVCLVGWPSAIVVALMVFELVAMPLLLAWHARLVRSERAPRTT